MSDMMANDSPSTVQALTQAVFVLALELWRTKDRQHALESVLAAQGSNVLDALETWRPTHEEDAAWVTEREKFVGALFEALGPKLRPLVT